LRSAIEVDNLSFRYLGRRKPALSGVSFQLGVGESLLVLGPSGCGKSSLALCLNGAIPQFIDGEMQGRVLVHGRDTRLASMAELAQRVGIVFQDPETQFCMLTVEEEVVFGLENLAVPRAEMDARISRALQWVGLADRRRDSIEHLSGGQKQRLALACVLAQDPQVLIFDEPTAQLDPAGAAEVVAIIDRLRQAERHTLIVIEHRLDDIMHLFDRTLVLDQAGQVVANGAPRQVLNAYAAWLAEAGVWVPQVSELGVALRELGLGVPSLPLSIPEAAEALRPLAPRLANPPLEADADATEADRARVRPLIELDGLTYRYPRAEQPTLDDVRLLLWPGQLAAVVGANGAGKSTLARNVVRILEPPTGRVRLNGTDVNHMRLADVTQHVGYVFQYPEHQFIGRSLLEDVAFGLRRAGRVEAEAKRLAQSMLDSFGLAHLAAEHPYSVSHGEQRRLSVAAMLVLDQPALFVDEPTFGQDRRNSLLLLDRLSSLAQAGRCIVAITHDMRMVAEAAQRVIIMIEGRIAFDGSQRAMFRDAGLMQRARLRPPPLWELSQRLGLPEPFVRVADLVAACRGLQPMLSR
jgi:energy-coupling factor transport system ATP-binding protein